MMIKINIGLLIKPTGFGCEEFNLKSKRSVSSKPFLCKPVFKSFFLKILKLDINDTHLHVALQFKVIAF